MLLRLPVSGQPRTILRLDAIFDFAVAVVLLVGPVRDLYELFAVPGETPVIIARLLAVPMFAFAGFLWLASVRERLRIPVALAAALANGISVPLILLWMLTGGSDMGAGGLVASISVALVLAIFSSLEFDIVRRSPMPPTPAADRR